MKRPNLNTQRLAAAPPYRRHLRVGPLRPMLGLLRETGHDPAAALVACGLVPTALDDPDNRVSFLQAAALVECGAALTGREDFGLLLGERFEIDSLGRLGQLLLRARTVGEALHDLQRFLHLQDRGAVAYLRTARPGVVALGYAVLDAETPGAALIHDLVMALALRLLQGLAGPNLRALAVSLPHAAPRALAPYRRTLGTLLHFDAPRAEIEFDAAWPRRCRGATPRARRWCDRRSTPPSATWRWVSQTTRRPRCGAC